MPATASVQVRTLFSPFDPTTDEYLQFVASAQHSVYLQIYGYHLPKLTDLLIAKHNAGVKVNLILDHSQEQGKAEHAEVQRLVDAKVPLLVGTSPVHGQILHSKFTVVDEQAVESGSWNYSCSAAAQSNTLTFVHDVEYARAYLDHWHKIHGFVALHDLVYQPQGAVAAEDVPAGDLPAGDIPADDTGAAGDPSAAPAAVAVPAPVAAPPASAAGQRARPTAPRGRKRAPAAAAIAASSSTAPATPTTGDAA